MMDWVRLTKSGKDLTGVGGCRSGGKVREVGGNVLISGMTIARKSFDIIDME
jgi:hypothetical protein